MGRRMSINVEVIGGSLMVQHYLEVVAEAHHLVLDSVSDRARHEPSVRPRCPSPPGSGICQSCSRKQPFSEGSAVTTEGNCCCNHRRCCHRCAFVQRCKRRTDSGPEAADDQNSVCSVCAGQRIQSGSLTGGEVLEFVFRVHTLPFSRIRLVTSTA
jgi:hypothetical protein